MLPLLLPTLPRGSPHPGHRLAAEAHFHLGLCFGKIGNRRRANASFNKVLAIDPEGIYGKQARTMIGQ